MKIENGTVIPFAETDRTGEYQDEIEVLDHGFVRLDSYHGDDLSVVNSARVSFGKRSESFEDKDAGLIKFLMRERHGTPFEHNSFTFHVKAPLFVVREWQRHRMASYNELSGRYSKFTNPDFYFPKEFRTQVGKPGAYSFETWRGETARIKALIERQTQDALDLYEYMIEKGIAKEQARIILPLNLYTEFYFTTNARSLMNFLSLRNSDQAMFEIREYAQALEAIWATRMPVTADAFRENRVAP
jgi:thymidylate synthase (FAD)